MTEDHLWETLSWFLERIVPVAEKAGVKLAIHPDNPPVSPLRGMGRIMRHIENYQRLLDFAASPVNGIALCQSNFSLMTDNLPGVIRDFGGHGKVFFVHLRDVDFDGPCRPDHAPTMAGDSNDMPA